MSWVPRRRLLSIRLLGGKGQVSDTSQLAFNSTLQRMNAERPHYPLFQSEIISLLNYTGANSFRCYPPTFLIEAEPHLPVRRLASTPFPFRLARPEVDRRDRPRCLLSLAVLLSE
jgi:hypothetical protein